MENSRNWISEFESICDNCHQGNNEILTYLHVICDYLIETEKQKQPIVTPIIEKEVKKEESNIINNKEDIIKETENGKKITTTKKK
jgi:hypothetical protein